MTANIKQNICPRRRQSDACRAYMSPAGTWHTKQINTSRVSNQSPFRLSISSRLAQRGTVTQSTLTITLAFISLACVAVLGFFYLQQVFSTSSQGSDVQALETQMNELRDKQRDLELQGAELRSLQAVEEHVKAENLVSVGDVSYLSQKGSQVAMTSGR